MSELQIGGRIDGKYEVLSHIGRGGMGEVYRVRHLHLEEQRVIKVMRPDLVRSTEAIDRFSNEARLTTKIKHPNVATLHDFSRLPDGSFYMVWEHIEGQDVEGWLQRRGRFPLPIALDLAGQVLSGLEAVHQEGIAHRDLSPDNLMITTDSRGRLGIKIIDLGLADQVTATGERSSQVGGKMNYCSPEHLGLVDGGMPPDQVSDLYSFAIVLYRMLTGVLPFPKAVTAADVAQRATVPARALSLDSVHQLMQKALSYQRRERYQLASDFQRDLSALGRAIEVQQQSALAHEGRARLDEVEEALRENRLADAEDHLRELEAGHPGLEGTIRLRSRLDELTQARQQVQVMQVREMLEQYLASKQVALAKLSLSSLLDIDPNYRDANAVQARIEALEESIQDKGRAERLLEQGRRKLLSGDRVSAQALHAQLRGLDQVAASQLQELLEGQDRANENSAAVQGVIEKIELLLESESHEEVLRELAKLEHLGVSKVTRDIYSRRLDQRLEDRETEAKVSEILRLIPEALDAEEWEEGWRLVAALQELSPDHPELGGMLQELDQGDHESRRRGAISEGVSTLTSLLDTGRIEEARLAFSVLLRMNGGDHPLKGHFEQRLAQLERD